MKERWRKCNAVTMGQHCGISKLLLNVLLNVDLRKNYLHCVQCFNKGSSTQVFGEVVGVISSKYGV